MWQKSWAHFIRPLSSVPIFLSWITCISYCVCSSGGFLLWQSACPAGFSVDINMKTNYPGPCSLNEGRHRGEQRGHQNTLFGSYVHFCNLRHWNTNNNSNQTKKPKPQKPQKQNPAKLKVCVLIKRNSKRHRYCSVSTQRS